MSLKITENKGVYFLRGNLNSLTSNFLLKYFEFLKELGHGITINIDLVNEIDAIGMLTLKNLYKSTIGRNQNFWITGNGCKEIYQVFMSVDLSERKIL